MSKQTKKLYILIGCMLVGAFVGWTVIKYVLKDSTAIVALKDGYSNSTSSKDNSSIDDGSGVYAQFNNAGNIKP